MQSLLYYGCDCRLLFDIVPLLLFFLVLAYNVYHEPEQVANAHAKSALSLRCVL